MVALAAVLMVVLVAPTAFPAPATGSTFDLRACTTIAAGTKLIIVGTNGGKLPITA